MSNSSWSLSLGCWSGVHVRLHVTLPLLMVCALLMSEGMSIYPRLAFPIDRVVMIVLLGFAAIAAHAASHIISAARHGIQIDELVFGPWGEWNTLPSPATPEAALTVSLAGLGVNVVVCALSAMVLVLAGDHTIREMLIPLDSKLLLEQSSQLITVRWLFCMNYCLVLMNLIPAAPFDGSRILKALLHLGAPHLSDEAIRDTVTVTGRLVGLLLIVVAIGLGHGDSRGLFPAWFPLTALGVVALFATEARLPLATRKSVPTPASDDLVEEPADDSGILSSDSVDWEDGPFAQWLEEKREVERARRAESKQGELADEHRADEILARLHERGSQALTAEDRQVLQRVSDRLRRRQEKKA